jgi:hypothetical protein
MEHLPLINEQFISGLIKHSQISKGKRLVESAYISDIKIKQDKVVNNTTVEVSAKCKASMKPVTYDIVMRFTDEDVDKSQCTCIAGYVIRSLYECVVLYYMDM